MKFEEVLPFLREGKKIRESFWKEGLYLVLNDLGRFAGTYIDFTCSKNKCEPSKIELDLLLKNDWEIIKEPKKVRVKLKDLTEKEFRNWKNEKCEADCEHCIFENVECTCTEWKNSCWVSNKNLYSDKFLDQEIEIEIADEPLLTKEEKEYLENVFIPYKDRIIYIRKQTVGKWAEINIKLESIIDEKLYDMISLPVFEKDKYYKNMEIDRQYTLKDLELFKE